MAGRPAAARMGDMPDTQDLQFERPVSDPRGDPDEMMLMEAMKGLFK